MSSKEDLVNKVLGLFNGSIAPDELIPKQLTIAVGYGTENQYFINDKEVSKDKFDLQNSKQECKGFLITYGHE